MIEDLMKNIRHNIFGLEEKVGTHSGALIANLLSRDIKLIIEEQIDEWERDGEITIND